LPGSITDKELDICANNLTLQLSNRELGGGATPLDGACKGTALATRDEYACDLAYALQNTLNHAPAAAEGYLVRALAYFVAEVATKNAPTDSQLTATLTAVNAMLSSTGSTEPTVLTAIVQLQTALGMANPPNALKGVLTQLVDQWKAFHLTGGKSISVATFSDSMGGLAAVITDGCAIHSNAKACAFFPNVTTVLGVASSLWTVSRLAESGDYVDAAQLAIEEIFKELKTNCTDKDKKKGLPDACEMLPFYERFADAMVVYAVQAHASGAPTDEARAVLRSATVDMVREIGLGGGIDRKMFGWEILLPDLSLRYDWSPSFVNVNPGAARAIASATWLKLRIPILNRQLGYTALAISLVDALAPLSELALRQSTAATYVGTEKLGWNLVSPHLDVEGGIPALSKHLVVGGGISYRFIVPWQTAAATTDKPVAYQYDTCFSHKSYAECLEFGIFAKYTM
jgi:hypothetical protein